MRFDAAVIGSGPAGATAARLLAQVGWSVALIERAGFPRRKVCGEFISAATMPVLEACGVAGDFLARAGPAVHKVAAYSGDTMVEAPLPHAKAGWGRALGREHLDVLLRDAAVSSGAMLFQPAEVAALSRRADLHILTLRRADAADEICARVVIAACGSWNTRGSFAVTAQPRPSDLFAFKAHFRGGALADGVMPLLAFPGGYGGIVHSDRGRITLSCCVRREELARAREIYGGKAVSAYSGEHRRCAARVAGGNGRGCDPRHRPDPARYPGPLLRRHILCGQCRRRGPSHHRRRHQHGDPVFLAVGAMPDRRRSRRRPELRARLETAIRRPPACRLPVRAAGDERSQSHRRRAADPGLSRDPYVGGGVERQGRVGDGAAQP